MDQIKNYIEQARQHGQDDASIKEALLSSGWDATTVQQALNIGTTPPSSNHQHISSSPLESEQAGDIPLLNRTDVPKKWSEFQQLKSIFSGLGLLIASPVIGAVIYNKDNHQAGILVGLLGAIFGLLLAVGSWISYLQLRRAEKSPKKHEQFQTSTATEYSVPRQSNHTTAENEVIINWIGPVIRADKGAIGHSILAKEVLKQAENTLLFTPTQIIAIMLTPADTQNIQQGALGSAASSYINYSSDTAADKNQEFRVLHSRRWDQLVANVQNQPLQNVLQSHLNYGIPYASIKSFKLKNSLINPGFVFELVDGSKLRFGVYRKDKIKEITTLLKQHAHIIE
jgi:hypothetical protein